MGQRPAVTVWVDGWQVQCCGEPFSVGSQVSWTLSRCTDPAFATAVLGDDLASSLTHQEEHHGGLPDDAPTTTGVVRSIRAVSCAYAPDADDRTCLRPVPGTSRVTDEVDADGWEPETDTLRFVAYIVGLDVASAAVIGERE